MTAGDRPLHEMNPVSRFSNRADDYVRFRPSYPEAAIDAILEGLDKLGQLAAADVGAGTGISSRQIAARGVRVIAIEPNASMRATAEPNPRVTWREGSAEATGLDGASVDLVVSAQAFHWFRQPEAIGEFHRILRPRGRLALMWNNRDHDDAATRGYIEAIRAVNGEHPAELRALDSSVIHESGHFASARLVTFEHHQELDRDGLVGRAFSASYVPKEGPAAVELRRLLHELFERHGEDGRFALRYRTKVYLAERR